MSKKLSYTFFLFFLINILISLVAPLIGLGINENYFTYELLEITRTQHFSYSLFFLLLTILFFFFDHPVLIKKKLMKQIRNISDFFLYFASNFGLDKYEKKLLYVGLFFQIIYFIYIPILFECDAASYFNSAKEILPYIEGSYNFDRGPFYPVFLILTGSIFPGTLSILLILQFVLGVYSGILFYKICSLFASDKYSFISSLILILSGLMLFGVKQILPYQFFLFSFFLCIYFFIKIIKFRNKYDVYAFYIIVCVSIFIRWEIQILFIVSTIFLLLLNIRHKLIFSILFSTALTIFVMFFYTILKFLVSNNPDHIGKIHMHSGSQIFWNIYSAAYPYELNGEIKNTSLVFKKNGPNTQMMYDILLKRLNKNKTLFESEKQWLSKEKYHSRKILEGEKKFVYYHLYDQYKSNPKALVDKIFHTDGYRSSNIEYNGFYLPFIVRQLKNEIGEKDAQNLLFKASYEAIVSNPGLYVKRRIHNFISFFNFNYLSTSTFYSLKTEYITIAQPYNLANCASDTLSPIAMNEYDFDRYIYEKLPFLNEFKLTSSFIRNCYRIFFGFSFILISFIFLFQKNRNKNILCFLILYNYCHMLLLSIYAGGAFTKYEVIVLILFLLTFTCFTSGTKKINTLNKNPQ